jgi:sulfite exporter TauE/SafE
MAEETNRPEDGLLAEGEQEQRRSTAARLFDVRRVIGGLFLVYGVIVTAIGVFDSSADLAKAQGVRINLWMGLAMLALGLLFLAWQWWRPAEAPEPPAGDGVEKGATAGGAE